MGLIFFIISLLTSVLPGLKIQSPNSKEQVYSLGEAEVLIHWCSLSLTLLGSSFGLLSVTGSFYNPAGHGMDLKPYLVPDTCRVNPSWNDLTLEVNHEMILVPWDGEIFFSFFFF